ncbi:oxetanocin A resistance protein [Paenibacillus sp. PK3_47]|uniref:pentapeptide repeat-containing protein n=1 Tax=Paenibacillus sp. PK3_47 TaxID=2072642 RepID=UPI00201D473F|nr:pentapeptide repeat-containing protein [Paenibacillus sp. PK3_47]UQZ37108.1 oxetanocin A resistance protein [Paenibacillus sp. PK3_47]
MAEHSNYSTAPAAGAALDLQSDCGSCFGLCCAALPFAASVDFAIDKAAGQPCHNLQQDFRCVIHTSLRQKGFRGCTVYDCFGAGQKVSNITYKGRDWRQAPETAGQMFNVFPVMRQLHELLWYLREALALASSAPIHLELTSALETTVKLTELPPEALLELDVSAHRGNVNELLLRTSELARAAASRQLKLSPKGRKKFGRGADLIGAKLKGADLRCANLRGAFLIAADLSYSDLRSADLIGADFRDTNLRGANLTDCIFLTQSQLNAAQGDAKTQLPPGLLHPAHWTAV